MFTTTLEPTFLLQALHLHLRLLPVEAMYLRSPKDSQLPGLTSHATCEPRSCQQQSFRLKDSFSDNAYGRIFANENPDDSGLTVESCIASCQSQNYTVAGLEYSVQCCGFCSYQH